MKYIDIKEKINTINQEYLQAVNTRLDADFELQKELLTNLKENKEKKEELFLALQNDFVENNHEKEEHFSLLQQEINKLVEDLNQEVLAYTQAHMAKKDKEQMLGDKENVLGQYKQQRKKETQDINIRINTLDKECISILKTKALEFEEEEKNHKFRLQELDKKMRFEVNKISDEILTPLFNDNPDELDKIQKNQAYRNDKKIQKLRVDGINEIAQIKLRYAGEIRKEKLNFINYACNYEKENALLREEYNQRIETLKYEKSRIQDNLQSKLDLYDFDVYRQENELEQKYGLEEIAITKKYRDEVETKEKEIFDEKKVFANEQFTKTVTIINEISNHDNAQIEIIKNDLISKSNVFNENLLSFHETFSKAISGYLDMLKALIDTFWDNFYAQEEMLNELVIHSTFAINLYETYDYKEYVEEVDRTFNSFKKEQQASLKKHSKQIKDLFMKIFAILKEIKDFNTIYNKDTHEKLLCFSSNLLSIVSRSKESQLAKAKATFTKDSLEKQGIRDEVLLGIKKEQQERANKEKEIKTNFNKKKNELEDKIKNYTSKQDSLRKSKEVVYKGLLKEIATNMTNIRKKYVDDLHNQTIKINQEYKQEQKAIEEERITKIKVGQI